MVDDILVVVNCKMNSSFCGKCCYDTEMILTIDDIMEIMGLGYSIDYFAELRDGYVRLRNINGHCVFLDPETNKCMIYKWRPVGCRLYPLIYDPWRDEILVDKLCPRADVLRDKIDTSRYKQLFRRILEKAQEAIDFYKQYKLHC
ncbi:YkgJ family cysteine cluster protein [Desulfurococcaceae archaeon MEX13E-LK6-19]|nr:YkgJ family cysteine cluster protein [Desulfurococcaceae archaeon MEX13E-LK6-19]